MSIAFEDLPLAVRPMRPADVPEIGTIERRAYHYPWSSGIFRDCLLAGYTCLVLDRGGQPVGYAVMSVAAAEAHVLNVCVHPDLQGSGHGRRLMLELLDRARDAGAERAFLEVRPSNAIALGLYRSLGFVHIGVRPRYYQAHRGREDASVLCLELARPQRFDPQR